MMEELIGSLKKVQDTQDKSIKIRLGTCDFTIEKTLKDGKKITVRGINPELVVKSFNSLEKELKK